MPDPKSADTIAALSERWQRDKSSRLFLQLAEELRRAGRTDEALSVLEDGLQWHPDSVAGLVVLGRCRLDVGRDRDAVASLERALELDAAQLVANKLLAEAWIRLGDTTRARTRLDIYRLLNERDSEIDELERRIEALERAPEPAGAEPGRRVFELEPIAERPPIELPPPAAGGSRREWAPFAEIHPRSEAERRIAVHLAGEGIFELALPAAAVAQAIVPSGSEPVPSALEPPPSPEAGAPSLATAAPAAAPVPPPPAEPATPMFSLQSIGDEVERETLEEPLAEVVARAASKPSAGRVASSTLAALYLQQGHLEEAEAEFRAVLEVRPGDDAALAGLVRLEQLRATQRTAADAGVPRPAGGLTRRKIDRLARLLDDLRRARRSRAGVP